MTHISSSCLDCGDITLRPDEIVVTDFGHEHRFEFDCPICELPVSHPAGPRTVAVLLAVGVQIVQAAELPGPVDQTIRSLRAHATYDPDNDWIIDTFHDELSVVDTLADIGWGE